MSILLDAVTRNSQQQSATRVDPVLTPRALYRPQAASLPLKHLSLLCVAIGLGVGTAWMIGTGNAPGEITAPAVNETASRPEGEHQPIGAGQQQTLQSRVPTLASSAAAIADIQLAGKVALPLAQAYVPSETPALVSQTTLSIDEDLFDDDNYDEAAFIDSVAYGHPVETGGGEGDAEPIILGAHPNRLGREKLAALKQREQKVVKDKPLRDQDALVAAFQAALKEVEVGNAVAKPVSAPELDPIVQPQQDKLPSYGQLPAALQLQVPQFNVNAHVYAGDPAKRWLNVDGVELQQGDKIQGKLTIVEIRPRDIVLSLEGTEFKVPAI